MRAFPSAPRSSVHLPPPGATARGFGGVRCTLPAFASPPSLSASEAAPMRDAPRSAMRLLLAALLFHCSFAPRASAGGGDPDDAWPPGLATAASPGSAANSPGASPAGKWNVEDPPGEHHDVKIDTRTGTWMTVDVSPDGKQIVFDLLGDLYVIPAEGGEARALTHGVSWDEQPRWSPNGKRIAFTSDRAGGDNLWVMDRDGSHARAVTQETFRLLNS